MPKHPLALFICAARGISCVAALVLAFAGQVLAGDDIPKFSDPDVNAYIKIYAEFTDQYIAAAKAAKNGDNRKMEALDAKAPELQGLSGNLAAKLRPEEDDRFTDFLTRCAEKMANASM